MFKGFSFSKVVATLGLSLGCGFLGNQEVQAASFQGLGFLPNDNYSLANAISADGKVVVGRSGGNVSHEAFRWTMESGMVGLGDFPGGDFGSEAFAVSADGSVIVGSGNSNGITQAFRWTSGGGMVGLGGTSDPFTSQAFGISADGNIVVGYRNIGGAKPFRWTSGSGMAILSNQEEWQTTSAHGISADGSIVVGTESFATTGRAFRWTSDGGRVYIDDLPGGAVNNGANGISTDGSTIVGYSESGNGLEAFRWTSSGGTEGLGDLAGGTFRSIAYGLSADGNVIVGFGNSSSGEEAFIWDSVNGMRNLKIFLTNSFGIDLTGWELQSARGISADGLTIVGRGINPSGNNEAWIARLDSASTPVPESSSVLGLFLITGFGVLAIKRQS